MDWWINGFLDEACFVLLSARFNPNGIVPQSPGLRSATGTELPWVDVSANPTTATRLCHPNSLWQNNV